MIKEKVYKTREEIGGGRKEKKKNWMDGYLLLDFDWPIERREGGVNEHTPIVVIATHLKKQTFPFVIIS